MQQGNLLVKFLKWRSKHINTRNFVLILSILIGIVSGLAAATIKHTVHFIQSGLFYVSDYFEIDYLFLVYPFIGLILTVAYVYYLNRNKMGGGIGNVLYSISRNAGLIERDKMYSQMVTSSLTVGFGGSVGLEAPIVSTGAAFGSNIAQLFHMDHKRRILLIGCGVSGAVAAVFAAPIAGVIFVFEVLLLDIGISYLIPLLLAAVSGMIVGNLLNSAEIIVAYAEIYHFSLKEIPIYAILGIITGFISLFFTRTFYFIEKLFLGLGNRFTKATVGALILGLLLFLFPPLFGEGYDIIRDLLQDRPEDLLDKSFLGPLQGRIWVIPLFILAVIFFKIIAASVTWSSGGNGGVFAPSLFLGALTGFLFARILNMMGLPFELVESSFALVAMAGIMSGVMHAPLTGIFLIAEVTSGYTLILPLMIVSAISYVTIKIFEKHSINTKSFAEKGELITRDKDQMVLNLLKLKRVVEKDLKSVHPDAYLKDLVEIIKLSKRNIFPVVDSENKLKGVILLDDIRQLMFNPEMYETVKVSALMHAPPGYVYVTDTMDQVMQKFKDTGAWNLPVLDNETYVGFLSKSKIFSIYRTLLINQTKEE